MREELKQFLVAHDEHKKSKSTVAHTVSQLIAFLEWLLTEAFDIACCKSNVRYTPHSARHTIAAERKGRRLTQEQRKAWTENMGHENEQITETHYGKLSDARRAELFEKIPEYRPIGGVVMTNEQKIELVDGVIEKLEEY